MTDPDILKERIMAHPAFKGGPADESYWLDFLEFSLAAFPEGLDTLASLLATDLERHPENWAAYIETSREDLLAYKTLQVLLINVRDRKLDTSITPLEKDLAWHAAICNLNRWAKILHWNFVASRRADRTRESWHFAMS